MCKNYNLFHSKSYSNDFSLQLSLQVFIFELTGSPGYSSQARAIRIMIVQFSLDLVVFILKTNERERGREREKDKRAKERVREKKRLYTRGYRPIGKWMDESGRKRVPLSCRVRCCQIN